MVSESISKEETLKVIELSFLDPETEPVDALTIELNSILTQVKKVFSVDVGGLEPMSHATSATDIFRADRVEGHLERKEIMQNVPDSSGRFIRVPIVIEG